MIEQFFFSKRNISLLNKVVLNTLNLQNKSKLEKKTYVQILISKMKEIYKSIDNSKINDSNINNILEQFNQWSIQETIKQIKNKIKNNNNNNNNNINNEPQISQIKLNRERSTLGTEI